MTEFTVRYPVKYRGVLTDGDDLVTIKVNKYHVEPPVANADSDWDANGYTDFDFDIIKVELFDEEGASIILEGEALENVEPSCEYALAFLVETQLLQYISEIEENDVA